MQIRKLLILEAFCVHDYVLNYSLSFWTLSLIPIVLPVALFALCSRSLFHYFPLKSLLQDMGTILVHLCRSGSLGSYWNAAVMDFQLYSSVSQAHLVLYCLHEAVQEAGSRDPLSRMQSLSPS